MRARWLLERGLRNKSFQRCKSLCSKVMHREHEQKEKHKAYRMWHMSVSNTMLFELRWRKVIVGLKSLWDPLSLRIGLYFTPKLIMNTAASSRKTCFLPLCYSFSLSLSLSVICSPFPALGQFCLISHVFTEYLASMLGKATLIYVLQKDDSYPSGTYCIKWETHIHTWLWFEVS